MPRCKPAGPLMLSRVGWAGRQTEQKKRKKGPVRCQYLCLYISPGPITAPSNRSFTMTRSWGKAWALKSYSIHADPLDRRRGWGEIKMKHFTEIKKRKGRYFYTRNSVQGLHFAVIICTNSVKREKGQLSITATTKKGNSKLVLNILNGQKLTFIIDLAISINVCFSNHFIHLLIC